MKEIALLRSIRDDEQPASTRAEVSGRRALAERITTPAPRRNRHGLVWASGTIAAVGLAAVLVFTDVVGLGGWRGGAEPAAAAVLHRAALATVRTSDPVVAPGQYLRVSTNAVYASISDDGSYLATQDGRLYIPADRSDDWVWVRDPTTVAKTFGPASEKAAQRDGRSEGDVIRAAEGAFYNGKPQDEGLGALPLDPSKLLSHIYRVTRGQGVSRDGEALVFIADTLRTGVVPAGLRAALYNAAARIPGVEITDRAANLDGHDGLAIGRDEADGIRQELIIDPSDGDLIGEREVLTRANVIPGWPAGTVMGYTAVTTTVVSSAPAGGSVCGTGSAPAGAPGSSACEHTG